LTHFAFAKRVRAVLRQDPSRLSPISSAVLLIVLASFPCLKVCAATPLNKATVTKVENIVNYGEVKEGHTAKRPAVAEDVVRPNNFLLTETESRAELKYEDGSVVRIGQNTVFSFDAATRTLSLDKGTLIFYIPKGAGGGTVKTPSLTAAITGTVGKVSDNMIAILVGEVTLVPSGLKVGAGQFARRNPDGTITIAAFDLTKAMDGRLMTFNGPMPGFDQSMLLTQSTLATNLSYLDDLERTQNHPAALEKLFPEEPKPDQKKKPQVTPPPTPVPTPLPTPRVRTISTGTPFEGGRRLLK
jgi:FecR protein